MKRKLMICAMALCICAGLTGNTGEVSVWASEGSSSDAVRIGALKGPTAMGMAQLLDEDGYDFTIAASPDEIVPMVVQDKLDIAAVPANLAATLYQKTDERFDYVTRETAPYVEWLGIQENPYGGGWAAGKDYGSKLRKILADLKSGT